MKPFKRCTNCKKPKDLSEFYMQTTGRAASNCKECTKARLRKQRSENREAYLKIRREWYKSNKERYQGYHLKSRHNFTVEQYLNLKTKQNGVCAICRGTNISRDLSVDHDHSCCKGKMSCGKCVRGLLCGNCNAMLGHAKDSLEILKSAIRYLEDSGVRETSEKNSGIAA